MTLRNCLRPLLAWAAALALIPAAPLMAQTTRRPLLQLDLAGEWRYLPNNGEASFAAPEVDDRQWPRMRLPSNWFLLGSRDYPQHADRALPGAAPGDIWPDDPARGLDWNGTVWFRRTFRWTGDGSRPVIIDLDMVDYHAEVFVNGRSAGRHEGYFQRWSLDLSRMVHPGENTLAVRVSAPQLPFDMSYRWPISWPRQQDQVKGIFLYHDTRPGATSPRGQERGTGGILRGIALRESQGVEVEELRVLPLEVGAHAARLRVEATVRNWGTSAAPVALRGVIVPHNFAAASRQPVQLRLRATPGLSRASAEVIVAEPRLWWSWDQGQPNLYRLEAALERAGADPVPARAVFGIRSITRDSSWVWRLNGRRIYPRGSNYISTQWLSQADRAWYERDVALMRGANLNSIRVHAHLERPEFYEVADSMGVMVWQDFPLQWGYTDQPSFHQEALRQAEDMVRRFANHPSIIVWCMHNESPHAMEWMKKTDPHQNLALDEALVGLVARLDPSRVPHRDSGTGDEHPYYGWYGGSMAYYADAKVGPFITEYGAQALPNLETLASMFPGDTLRPHSSMEWEAWTFRDFQPENTRAAGIDPQAQTDAFIAASQRYQAQTVRYATEAFRRRKWAADHPTTGIYHFMLVDDWPSVTWSVLDYYRRAKPGYDALRLAMQPVLPSIVYRIENRDAPLSLVVVNDLPRALRGASVRWRVTSAEGRVETEGTAAPRIGADTVVAVAQLGSLPTVTRGSSLLEVWVEGAAGEVLGRNRLSASDFLEEKRPQSPP